MTVILLMPASHVQPFVEDQSIRVSETEVTRKTGLIVLQIGKVPASRITTSYPRKIVARHGRGLGC